MQSARAEDNCLPDDAQPWHRAAETALKAAGVQSCAATLPQPSINKSHSPGRAGTMVRRSGSNSTSSPAPLCRAGVLLLCLRPETESWWVRTAVSLRGEEPPANVLRSSYTCSLNAPVSERESGFVVWTRLAGKYEVLPSRQPRLLGGKCGGKNQ